MRHRSPKADRGIRSLRQIGVERNDRGQPDGAIRRIDQPELMASRPILDQQMRTVFAVAPQDVSRQVAERKAWSPVSSGRRRQDDDRRQFVGMPEDGRFIGALIWVGQEVVTPSAERGLWSRDRLRPW